MATLSLNALKDALANLDQAIAFAKKHKALGEMDYYKQFRTASIQSFEYSYDIGQKLIKRFIENSDIYKDQSADLDFRDYMRVAAEYGLLQEPEQWVEFREWRNDTSHTYDAEIAEALFVSLPEIVASIRHTCEQLEKRSAS